MYDGHPLSYWVLDDTNSPVRSDIVAPGGQLNRYSEEAVENIGTNAIPFLLKWMESDSPYRAANAFGVLGPAARSAIPDLARLGVC